LNSLVKDKEVQRLQVQSEKEIKDGRVRIQKRIRKCASTLNCRKTISHFHHSNVFNLFKTIF